MENDVLRHKLGMGIVWVFSDTGAKPVLLKRYQFLNGARTDTLKKKKAQTDDWQWRH